VTGTAPVTYRKHVNAVTTTWPARARAPEAKRDFGSVAETHLDDVYAYLLYVTGDAGLAEDLTSDTFERALRRWGRFDPRRASAKTWLCLIARSSALDHLRAERRRRRREEAVARPEKSWTEQRAFEGLSPELEAALRKLSAADREVIALRVVLDLDAASTARLLGMSESACSTRLSRALRKLEEMIGTHARD
jgi:RNA polymerase sigma-70 factor, ECF subfamily